jgi:hypothetical protein
MSALARENDMNVKTGVQPPSCEGARLCGGDFHASLLFLSRPIKW